MCNVGRAVGSGRRRGWRGEGAEGREPVVDGGGRERNEGRQQGFCGREQLVVRRGGSCLGRAANRLRVRVRRGEENGQRTP